jgi:imidazoleglycerol-phosphate dehydratase
MRTATVTRITAETDIALTLALDGTGEADTATGCGFLDHMLTLFARHGRFTLAVRCNGDTGVDDHHTVEDVGIALGQALRQALGDMRGVTRYADVLLPMDESLALVALDLSGRGTLIWAADMPTPKVGTFDTELGKEFFLALTREAKITLHVHLLTGENSHHILEAIFKGFGRALRKAVAIDPACSGEIPSTKGTLGGEA